MNSESSEEDAKRDRAIIQFTTCSLSPLQQEAVDLYSLGFNVFPMPYGRKSGYSWKMMQYTRLNPEDLYRLFDEDSNLAIMTGRTSENLFVIDCETRTTFKYHEGLLREAGIPIWASESGGNRGGGHFFLRSKNGEVKGVRAGERKDYEVRGNRCYVLAPPSLHPDRKSYRWYERETPAPPIVTLNQVPWLSLTLTKDTSKYVDPEPFSDLSENTRRFLLVGAPEGERNNQLFAAACDMAGNRYAKIVAQQLLGATAKQIGLSRQEILATIESAYSKNRTPSKPQSGKKKPPAHHEKAIFFTKDYQWAGRTGQTNRARVSCMLRESKNKQREWCL